MDRLLLSNLAKVTRYSDLSRSFSSTEVTDVTDTSNLGLWVLFVLGLSWQSYGCTVRFDLTRTTVFYTEVCFVDVMFEVCSAFHRSTGTQEGQEEAAAGRGWILQCVLHVWAEPDSGVQRGEVPPSTQSYSIPAVAPFSHCTSLWMRQMYVSPLVSL